MEELIDLGDVADSLAEMFPNIKSLYLFGSRAFGTGSPRSDIDILVEYEGHIRPADVREFIKQKCEALDLFLIDGHNKAVSTQNESYVEAESIDQLITKLSAKKFWEKDAGRLQIDIQWKQRVRDDVAFVLSVMPGRPKNNEKLNPDNLTIGQIFKALTIKQLFASISTIVFVLITVFGGGYWLGSNTIVMKEKPHDTSQEIEEKPNKPIQQTPKSRAADG